MCQHQILTHRSNGYIIRCPECGSTQLAFGTTMVTMNQAQFGKLARHIDTMYAERSLTEEADPSIKQYVIPIGSRVMCCLNAPELVILHSMFLEAKALLETYQILEQKTS